MSGPSFSKDKLFCTNSSWKDSENGNYKFEQFYAVVTNNTQGGSTTHSMEEGLEAIVQTMYNKGN